MAGCKPKDNKGEKVIDLTSYKYIELTKLLAASQFIPLEYTKESILDPNGLMSCTDIGFFYTKGIPKSIIYHFDNDGKFKNTIGNIGKGPGEFSSHGDIVITDEEVIFAGSPQTHLYYYDFSGKFIRSVQISENPFSSFASHPETGDYFLFTPMNDYLLYQLDSQSLFKKDSIFVNGMKRKVSMSSFYRTAMGTLLFHDPMDYRLNVYEIHESVELKYIFDYGLNLDSYSRNDERASGKIYSNNNEVWHIRAVLENQDWLYICMRSQEGNIKKPGDLHNLIFNKNTKDIYRLPGHLQDDTYFGFGFWLNKDNTLSIIINPHQIMDNPYWLEELKKRDIDFQIDGNPIVVQIQLDRIAEE